MANHINHYKSLKKKHIKSKREEIPKHCSIYPSTLFALFFVLFFLFFCCSFFYNDSIFFLSSPSFLGLCCCLLLLPSFEFHTKTIFFPISFIFHFCPDIFSTDLYVCYIFIHISPFAVAISFMRCFHFFCCSLSVCVFNEYCSFVSQSFVWLPESSRYSCHDVCLKHLNCTVLYWNRQKLDLMELLHL